MTKKNVTPTAQASAQEASGNIAFVPCAVSESKKFKICDVCGHANPESAALCKVCSNYLEGV